jgi:exopolysaccharide biosynthesis WecB/TagA/CpsF family protein
MKVTIITAALNSAKTIGATLNSVKNQNYKNIEHIIVDGGSTDETVNIINKYSFKNKKIILGKDNSLYQAINKGIIKSSGDIISILNSDDIFQNESVIRNVVNNANKKKKINIFLTDVVFFSGKLHNKITRFYSCNKFNVANFKYGLMPPHPGSFIRKKIYNDFGLYDENFKIASDFDLLCKFIFIKKISHKYIKMISVRMRTGGISGKNIKAYIVSSIEIVRSLKKNQIKSNIFNVLLRIPTKLKQFFNYQNKNLNNDFRLKISDEYYDYFKKRFKMINNIRSINFKQNFVLSALNLAFLGYFAAYKINNFKELITWPDGIFSKLYGHSIKKIPGREIIRKLKLPKEIKELVIVGNISTISLEYLKKRFKLPVQHRPLPYLDAEELKKITNFKTKKKQLIFITLPTPKQEIIAENLASINKCFFIICIGASINIASGEEKEVPKFLKSLEFIWRLKYETSRRVRRLIESFFYFSMGRFIIKTLKEVEIVKN